MLESAGRPSRKVIYATPEPPGLSVALIVVYVGIVPTILCLFGEGEQRMLISGLAHPGTAVVASATVFVSSHSPPNREPY